MVRKDLLKKLKAITPEQYIDNDSSGYGNNGTVYCIDEEGVKWCGNLSGYEVHKCDVYSENEFNDAKKRIENGLDVNEYDEIEHLVKAGCKPNVQYFRLGDDFVDNFEDELEYFKSYEEAFNEVSSMFESEEILRWDDASDDELKHWWKIYSEDLSI